MQINTNGNTSFGLKIVKTDTYKKLLSSWQASYSKEQIKRSLEKIKNATSNDYFIKIENSFKKNKIKVHIWRILDDKSTCFIPFKFTNKRNYETKCYSPKYFANKLLQNVRRYIKSNKNCENPTDHPLVYAAKAKARSFFQM